MKKYLLSALFVFFLVAFLPFVSLMFTNRDDSEKTLLSYTVADNTNGTSRTDNVVRVLQVSSSNVITVDLTEYLIGAVASEMPASFSDEALKAQAVACYTYLKWIMLNADNAPNEFSDISDDSNTHQGYLSEKQMKERWGSKYETYYSKLRKIVESVEDQYITYNNEPVLAVFHGISPGATSDSEDVWSESLPYLVSVDAPGDKLSADLVSKNSFTVDEFRALAEDSGVNFSDSDDMIKVISSADNGHVKQVKLGDKTLSGTDIRRIFSLKSPNFTVSVDDSRVVFTVYGKGHGLGMSQYSADFMARQGYNHKEILSHFYPGTEISDE